MTRLWVFWVFISNSVIHYTITNAGCSDQWIAYCWLSGHQGPWHFSGHENYFLTTFLTAVMRLFLISWIYKCQYHNLLHFLYLIPSSFKADEYPPITYQAGRCSDNTLSLVFKRCLTFTGCVSWLTQSIWACHSNVQVTSYTLAANSVVWRFKFPIPLWC